MSKLKRKLETRRKYQNSRKKIQGENSKSRHFQDPWVPEKRPKKSLPQLPVQDFRIHVIIGQAIYQRPIIHWVLLSATPSRGVIVTIMAGHTSLRPAPNSGLVNPVKRATLRTTKLLSKIRQQCLTLLSNTSTLLRHIQQNSRYVLLWVLIIEFGAIEATFI